MWGLNKQRKRLLGLRHCPTCDLYRRMGPKDLECGSCAIGDQDFRFEGSEAAQEADVRAVGHIMDED